jgi:hypothetical protein
VADRQLTTQVGAKAPPALLHSLCVRSHGQPEKQEAPCLRGQDEYEAIRSDEMRFAVLVGHVMPEVERVVSEHDGRYVVVEKREEVRAIAEDRFGPRVG